MQIHEITLKEATPLSPADAAEMEKRRQKAAQIAGADPMTQAVGNWLANKIGPRGLPSQQSSTSTTATAPKPVTPQTSSYRIQPGRRVKIAVQYTGQEQPSFYYKNSDGAWTNELGQRVSQSSYAALEKYLNDNGGKQENDPNYVNPNDQVKTRKVSRKR